MEQVVILAGGKGTRMREMTEDLPKPMVPIGGMPVLNHLIKIFEKKEILIHNLYRIFRWKIEGTL